MNYAIVTNRPWCEAMAHTLTLRTGRKFSLITDRKELTLERLQAIGPRYLFFPHWSYIIPREIHENYECVIFHMTDVPFGRGGSPLQNLISRGIYKTKLTALRCVEDVDAGPVYLKRPFSLEGSAREIYLRMALLAEDMIVAIVESEPVPVPQEGEVIMFPRRKPEEGSLAGLREIRQIYDYIRMLDADGYPPAFLETERFLYEFEQASFKDDRIVAHVTIRKKE